MAQHEFGVMVRPPEPGSRYDESEPEKYGCVTIDDDFIEPVLAELDMLKTYYHTTSVPGIGLAYCGITSIPPESLKGFENVLLRRKSPAYDELISLLRKAREEDRFVIHFGL